MKLSNFTPRKNAAQAIVEFAIVLPILLLLLYGLLEAGRLLFMYSTVVTASRQAARYGSATGQAGDYTAEGGPDNSALSRYQDCYGIKRAAQRVDFLNAFDDDDIYITYDNGPGTGGLDPLITPPTAPPWRDVCDGTGDNAVSPDGNTTRIVVTIGGDFLPIVPRIVPFIARTRAGSNPITAISARTIITGVSIEVTPPPGSGGGPGTGGLSLSIIANPNSFTGPNETISYTFTLTNGGTTDISGPFTITGAPFSVDCSAATTPLTPGSSTDCTVVTYLTTQADVDTGFVEFTATATGTDSGGNPVTDDATSKITYSAPVENPAISLTKTASTDLVTAGDVITYTFTVSNVGNVDLTAASVSDPKLGGTIAGCSGDLAVGASLTCTGSYTVTSTDVSSGSVDNTATASATYNTTSVTATASATADIYEGTLFLTVDRSPASLSGPGTVTYTYRIKNNTSGILYLQASNSSFPPLSGYPGSHNCGPGQLNPGATVTCTGTYNVTQTVFDNAAPCTGGVAGYCLENTIRANACTAVSQCNGNRDRTSNDVTVRVSILPSASLSLQVTASPTAPIPPATSLQGQSVTYTYTLTNTGNVTLKQPFTVVDSRFGNITCDTADIAPNGGTKTCTKVYPVTQADLDAGLIPAHDATATATFGSQTVSAVAQVPVVTTYSGPRLRLEIFANPTTYPAAPSSQPVIYTYRLTNTGTVPLSPSPLYLTSSQQSDGRSLTVSCPNTPLAEAGDFVDCTATDTVSGPTGSSLTNTATAQASDGTQTITSNTATVRVSNPPICTSVTLTADADTWIDQDSPSTQHGTDQTLIVRSRNNRNARLLVRFPITVPTGCTIGSATLQITSSGSTGRTLQAWQVANNWTESTTWNAISTTPWTGTAATTGSGSGALQWNVTSIVQAIVSSPNNYGFIIKDASENASGQGVEQSFSSRESTNKPQLLITFTPAP